jgi:predicted adenine nucleotide alpha hydrolase (AANH) superfamily ATPase
VIERLIKEGHEVTGYFYNPNIQPSNEYRKRLEEARKYCALAGIDLVVGNYEYNDWSERTHELADEPEGGKRCNICYEIRLNKTGENARANGFEGFTTTLSISPYKDSDKLNNIGEHAAERYGVSYYRANFKKKNGYKKSIEKSKCAGLYRQDYCGCTYSRNEYEKRLKVKNSNSTHIY